MAVICWTFVGQRLIQYLCINWGIYMVCGDMIAISGDTTLIAQSR